MKNNIELFYNYKDIIGPSFQGRWRHERSEFFILWRTLYEQIK
jgi:hypothetical protein